MMFVPSRPAAPADLFQGSDSGDRSLRESDELQSTLIAGYEQALKRGLTARLCSRNNTALGRGRMRSSSGCGVNVSYTLICQVNGRAVFVPSRY